MAKDLIHKDFTGGILPHNTGGEEINYFWLHANKKPASVDFFSSAIYRLNRRDTIGLFTLL